MNREKILKEVAMAYFKVLFQQVLGRNEETSVGKVGILTDLQNSEPL
jgi:hypothetical protein